MQHRPCAACKLLRRKCTEKCIFAPHFPANQPHRFSYLHKVYGAGNVAKFLITLPLNDRDDAVNSLFFEAESRLHDPIFGTSRLISHLQNTLHHLYYHLENANRELAMLTMLPNLQPPLPDFVSVPLQPQTQTQIPSSPSLVNHQHQHQHHQNMFPMMASMREEQEQQNLQPPLPDLVSLPLQPQPQTQRQIPSSPSLANHQHQHHQNMFPMMEIMREEQEQQNLQPPPPDFISLPLQPPPPPQTQRQRQRQIPCSSSAANHQNMFPMMAIPTIGQTFMREEQEQHNLFEAAVDAVAVEQENELLRAYVERGGSNGSHHLHHQNQHQVVLDMSGVNNGFDSVPTGLVTVAGFNQLNSNGTRVTGMSPSLPLGGNYVDQQTQSFHQPLPFQTQESQTQTPPNSDSDESRKSVGSFRKEDRY